jgi:hypothetical protein
MSEWKSEWKSEWVIRPPPSVVPKRAPLLATIDDGPDTNRDAAGFQYEI